jgi:hypothetical protein
MEAQWQKVSFAEMCNLLLKCGTAVSRFLKTGHDSSFILFPHFGWVD